MHHNTVVPWGLSGFRWRGRQVVAQQQLILFAGALQHHEKENQNNNQANKHLALQQQIEQIIPNAFDLGSAARWGWRRPCGLLFSGTMYLTMDLAEADWCVKVATIKNLLELGQGGKENIKSLSNKYFISKLGRYTAILKLSHGHTDSIHARESTLEIFQVQNNSESKNTSSSLFLQDWLGSYQRNRSNQRCICCSPPCGLNLSNTFPIWVSAQVLWPFQATVRHHTLTQTQWDGVRGSCVHWRVLKTVWGKQQVGGASRVQALPLPSGMFFFSNELEWPGGALSLEPRWIFHRASLGCEDRFWRREVKCRSGFFFVAVRPNLQKLNVQFANCNGN